MPTIQFLLDKKREVSTIVVPDSLLQLRSGPGRQPEAPQFMQIAAAGAGAAGRTRHMIPRSGGCRFLLGLHALRLHLQNQSLGKTS